MCKKASRDTTTYIAQSGSRARASTPRQLPRRFEKVGIQIIGDPSKTTACATLSMSLSSLAPFFIRSSRQPTRPFFMTLASGALCTPARRGTVVGGAIPAAKAAPVHPCYEPHSSKGLWRFSRQRARYRDCGESFVGPVSERQENRSTANGWGDLALESIHIVRLAYRRI